MPLLGKGALAIWNAITAEGQDDFYRWHNTEHMPERVGVPGFLRGRRWVSTSRSQDYFTLYETESEETIRSAPYLARLNDPTPWTRRVLPNFRDTFRLGCRVAASWGRGEGGALVTLRLQRGGENLRTAAESSLALVRQLTGVIGVHLLEPAPETTRIPTREREIRGVKPGEVEGGGGPDPWILLVECNDPELAESVLRGPVSGFARQADTVSGVYRLQFSLDRD